ncbi:beta-glucosidase BglX [Formosa haliotis]|uniref:beta-glucosidase BglX n=1 Tax=Formosa haliotis TaxID=1555194 RepID=UPI000824E2F6|nr:beta-glucosidase BglX [Formosa haliotis]
MRHLQPKLLFILALLIFTGKSTAQNNTIIEATLEHKVDSVLSLMTLQEKIGQLNQYNGSWDVTGIPSDIDNKTKLEKLKNGDVGSMLNVLTVEATREAQSLVMEHSRLKIPLIFGYDVIHGYKTIFPTPLAESASWDLEAMKLSASIAAKEASAEGLHWTFAPMIDVSRDARWGRIMEGSGEDPFLTSAIGVARIQGFQGNDLSDPHTIAACAKHFAGYGFAESGRDYNTVNIGEHELQNVILPPFKAASDAGVATFMNAFNEIDGQPATANSYLQRTLLKGEWGFDGFVVSDWGSIAELIPHGVAKNKLEAANLAIHAGSDMDMEGRVYEDGLKTLVEQNRLDIALIDDAVKRVLRVKFRLGLFDDPYRYSNAKREKTDILTKEHLAISRDVAKKSIVLLKNEKSLLPLSKTAKNIAVIGPLANDKDSPIGNWRAQGEKNSAVSVLEGITNAMGKNANISYAKGTDLSIGERSFLAPLTLNTTDTSGFNEAITIAKHADVVLMVLGEDAFQSGEGRSQANIGFAGLQQELLEAVYAVNKNIVLVLMNGRPMEISWAADHIPAILEVWHLGSEHGNAVADVLFGDDNPSGKLPVSFPRAVGQEPFYYNQKNTGRPSANKEVTYSHHNDVSNEALFPFGYGLSYTSFKYSEVKLSSNSFHPNETVTASVDITNIGKREGKEIVQLYIRDLVGSITRPIKELKGFEIIELKPGETKTVSFKITAELLSFFTANKKWETEAGDFHIFIGSNSTVNAYSKLEFVKN